MGLGSTCQYTPTGSGIVAVMVMGAFQTDTSTTTVTISGRYAPTSGEISGQGFQRYAPVLSVVAGAKVQLAGQVFTRAEDPRDIAARRR